MEYPAENPGPLGGAEQAVEEDNFCCQAPCNTAPGQRGWRDGDF